MKKTRRNIFMAVCTVPAIILFVFFTVVPTINVFKMSLYKWSGLSATSEFVGMANFKTLLGDQRFWTAFKNNIFFMIVVTTITMTIALFFAVVLTQAKLKEKNFYRVVFFFPNILSLVVISILFVYIYDPSMGILNSLLDGVGLGNLKQAWLGDSGTVLWAISGAMIWQGIGYYMVMYMAGIDGIPAELYEAATVEGAGKGTQFFAITIPLLWEIIRVTIVFFITSTLNMSFIFVKVMTAGGPNGKSEVLLSYMYKQAFEQANYGYAMAIAVIVFLFCFGLAFLSNKLTEKETIQY